MPTGTPAVRTKMQSSARRLDKQRPSDLRAAVVSLSYHMMLLMEPPVSNILRARDNPTKANHCIV
jgi:hypothetical protein